MKEWSLPWRNGFKIFRKIIDDNILQEMMIIWGKKCVNLKLKSKLSYKFIFFFILFYKNISSRLFFI